MAPQGGVRIQRIQNIRNLARQCRAVNVRGEDGAGESGVSDVVERQRGPRQGDGAET